MNILFEKFILGSKELKNRLVFPPITTAFATLDGQVTDKLIRHYEARARGGVGLIIVEPGITNPRAKLAPHSMGIYNDSQVEPLKKISAAVKKHNATCFLQLCHAGPRARSRDNGVQPVSASNFTFYLKDHPRALTLGEIQWVQEEFVLAAERAREAGFDGVELHAAHFYLLSAFLSPITNRRADAYGGDTRGRALLVCQIIKGIKSRLGSNFPVTVRYHGAELGQEGINLAEAISLGREFEAAGADGLHISSYDLPYPGLEHFVTIPASSIPGPANQECCFLPYSAAIKKAVSIPVIGVGKITGPEMAARALLEGQCDLVAMGRALLADPELPNKALQGQGYDKCLGCMNCFVSLGKGELNCTVNPYQ